MFSTTEVIDSYAEYLRAKNPESLPSFVQRRASDPEAALAEAVVFSMLQGFRVRPEINDKPGTGGADFICSASGGSPFALLRPPSPESQFIVEATSLDPDAVTDRTNLPNEAPDEIGGGAFGLLTKSVLNKVKAKATQLSGYPMPRVLAIASGHFNIGAVFNAATAVNMLVSDFFWKQEIGSNQFDPNQYTNLDRSVFMKPGPDGSIVATRQSISALLLVGIYGDQSHIYGILHPEAAYPLNIGFLPKVPFLRIAKWPITDGRIMTEWVVAEPDGLVISHYPIRLPRAPRAQIVEAE